jgi:glycosyltransferase involved in cell wall biosynthesis
MRSRLDLRAGARLRSVLRDEGAELLHTHLFHADWMGRRAARRAGVRAVVSTIHGLEWRRPWRARLARSAGHVDRVVCVSEAVRREAVRRGAAPADRLAVIHNGVDPTRFTGTFDREATRRSLGVGANDPLVVSLGRLRPEKGHDLALRALRDMLRLEPRARLAIVGDGPERRALERLRRSLGLEDAATMTGHREDVPAILHAADCVMAASRSEGFGLAIAEAMAAGRAVVAAAVDAVGELVEPGVSGILVPPGDFRRMAEAACDLLADPARAEAIGGRARLRVNSSFTLEAMLGAYASAYRAVLQA